MCPDVTKMGRGRHQIQRGKRDIVCFIKTVPSLYCLINILVLYTEGTVFTKPAVGEGRVKRKRETNN